MENYNGWSNYATWLISLEWFDGLSCEDITGEDLTEFKNNLDDLATSLNSYVESVLTNDTEPNSTAYRYALEFISNVNWLEIAQHLYALWSESEVENV